MTLQNWNRQALKGHIGQRGEKTNNPQQEASTTI